ncbi:MAG: hypothetical protein ABIE84_01810 [bacterium]
MKNRVFILLLISIVAVFSLTSCGWLKTAPLGQQVMVGVAAVGIGAAVLNQPVEETASPTTTTTASTTTTSTTTTSTATTTTTSTTTTSTTTSTLPTLWRISGISESDPQVLLIVGDNGVAYYSNNAGDTWSVIDIGTTETIRWCSVSVYGRFFAGSNGYFSFYSNTNGWLYPNKFTNETIYDAENIIVGANGLIGQPGDYEAILTGVSDVALITSGTTNTLRDIRDPSASTDTLFVVGDNGTILRSDNDGNEGSWRIITPETGAITADLYKIDLDVYTPSGGLIVGAGGTLLTTNDSGETWSLVTNNYPYAELPDEDIYSFCDDSGFLIMVGANGTLYRAFVGNLNNSTAIDSGTTNNLYDVYINNSGDQSAEVWAVGANKTLIKSEDGGLSWDTITLP